ncbi:hypothetical protein C7293_12500 [filamentous cyanobacterium CCT1]|nr:hypothetical protein C7293_12500 [filamentous cyanobacterium CCT1]PSN79815.1 hypothetical protein C8B47_09675 [filamentous cyanobacterium CCP4]
MPDISAKISGFSLAQAQVLPAIANALPGSDGDSAEANWQAGELWQLYEEDWQFNLPAEYANKESGKDYHFVETGKPLRHSAYLIDGLADGQRDGWTSMADEVAAGYPDFDFKMHPEPALKGVQPWKINGDRVTKILNHGAARAVVLQDGTILKVRNNEIEPRKSELLALFAEGACFDWTGTLFEPGGSRIEFEQEGRIQFAVLDENCYPVIPAVESGGLSGDT